MTIIITIVCLFCKILNYNTIIKSFLQCDKCKRLCVNKNKIEKRKTFESIFFPQTVETVLWVYRNKVLI